MNTVEREHAEAQVALGELDDEISRAVGSRVYSSRHRFRDMRMGVHQAVTVSSSALAVSRFYFAVQPQVVVDIVEHPDRFEREIAVKRAYCARVGIKYVLVTDDGDEETVRRQLTPERAVGSKPRTTADKPVRRPRTRK